MDALTILGLLAVAAMLVFYACEDRSAAFVLAFAAACLAAAAYGFLQGAWPFGVVETIWAGVAVRRWQVRRAHVGGEPAPRRPGVPIACDMSALTADERGTYDRLRASVRSSVDRRIDTPAGFRVRCNESVLPRDIAEWLALERRCCPFLTVGLELGADGTWIQIQALPEAREFLTAEFAAFAGS
jgi:hypothetical protein